jgi:hypothetical protein
MTARRLARFGSRATERRWPSLIVSLAVSVGLFIAAFASMTSLPRWVRRDQRAVPELPVLVQIPTLPARRTPVAPKTIRAPNRAANPPDRPHVPPNERVAPVAASPVDTGLASPAESTATARDTTGARSSSTGRGPVPSTNAVGTVKGAPIAPAGVTYDHRAANTPEVRDSIAHGVMDNIAELARTRAPTGRELADLETRGRNAISLRQRTSTAGNSRDLVILQGSGLDGVGAVTGRANVVTAGLPLFSSGPSSAQRKKNDSLVADYQRRLRRLQDRYLKRDSIRADSIRADSVRRDSVARAHRTPDQR